MFSEFKEFILRGNVIDLAVGIVIGASFTAIVQSFVNDLLMPPIGLLIGNVDFTELFVVLGGGSFATLAEAREAGAATIAYGVFINHLVHFLIVALAVFLLVRQVNAMRRRPEVAAPAVRTCPYCISPVAVEATRCAQCTSSLA
jgi:large conductance mechanosensitive channel